MVLHVPVLPSGLENLALNHYIPVRGEEKRRGARADFHLLLTWASSESVCEMGFPALKHWGLPPP